MPVHLESISSYAGEGIALALYGEWTPPLDIKDLRVSVELKSIRSFAGESCAMHKVGALLLDIKGRRNLCSGSSSVAVPERAVFCIEWGWDIKRL